MKNNSTSSLGEVVRHSFPLKKGGKMKANVLKKDNIINLPTKSKPRIICSKEDWKRMDREEAVKKQCEKTFNDYFIRILGRITPRPKHERPKTSSLTRKIYNLVTLENE